MRVRDKNHWFNGKDFSSTDLPVWKIALSATAKPTIGLRPEFIVLEHRQKEIQEAVTRYMEAGEEIPKEWTAEYYRNNSRLLEIK